MDPEDMNYICTLDDASIKKAKEELNEDPQDRLAAVQALRNWVKEQPHITCPALDTSALLMFLRGSKFSQLRAREMFENNLKLKEIAPEWFKDIDPTEEILQDILSLGYVMPLPKRTKDGCSILLYRPAAIPPLPKKYPYDSVMRTGMLIGALISQSEMTQVNGTVFIFDFTGMTSGHMTNMMNRKALEKFHKMWTKNIPGRFKSFHYYNAGMFFEAMMAVTRPFLPKKFQQRIKTHDTLESLYKYVPMDLLPEEYLPDDYTGPNAGPLEDIIKQTKDATMDEKFRNQVLHFTSNAYSVDYTKKPVEKIKTHFRKLNVS